MEWFVIYITDVGFYGGVTYDFHLVLVDTPKKAVHFRSGYVDNVVSSLTRLGIDCGIVRCVKNDL